MCIVEDLFLLKKESKQLAMEDFIVYSYIHIYSF